METKEDGDGGDVNDEDEDGDDDDDIWYRWWYTVLPDMIMPYARSIFLGCVLYMFM